MNNYTLAFQQADWRAEKHVPAIEGPEKTEKGKMTDYSVSVGKEIAHPNTTEHHIRWIDVYFLPNGEKFPIQIAKADFFAHGESTQGPNTSTVYTNHSCRISFKTDKSGTLFATTCCNIHGLWMNSKTILIE